MNQNLFSLDAISWRGLCLQLLRNFWMILLAAGAVWLGVTGAHNLTYHPQYSSSATLVVTVQGDNSAYSSLSITASMADVFSQVFQSDALRNRIGEDLGEEMEGSIRCSVISETNLLTLTATSPDPRQAYLFLNSALQNYDEVAAEVFSNASLQLLQEPQVPSAPSNTSWLMARRNLLTAAGALGMTALLCLLYLMRFTVKNPAGASRLLDGQVRGVIPFEKPQRIGSGKKRALQAPLLSSPLVSMNFAEAGRRAEAAIEAHMHRNRQKILLVASVTENEGKSTVAANLALALAEKHKKVLLVDGDLRKPAQYKIFNKKEEPAHSLGEVLREGINWREALCYHRRDRLWQLFQFRPETAPASLIGAFVSRGLGEEMKEAFDYIILDCPPVSVASDAELWLEAADTAILVIREDWADVRVINDTVDMIWKSGGDFAGFVLNAFHREWGQSGGSYGYGGYSRERG